MIKIAELKFQKLKNGETIAYRVDGEGSKNLLLIHGNMTSSKHWDRLINKLKVDYKILAVDLRGFGGSSYNKPIDSLKDFAEDIEELLDILEIKNTSVAGWSTGGGVALELAASLPNKIEKVVLIESVGVKGYPIFKKDENNLPTQELALTREEISEDPVQVKPVINALATKNKEFYRFVWNATIYTHNKPLDDEYEEYLEDMLTQRNLVDVDYALVHFNMTNEFNGINNGSDRAKLINQEVLIIQGDRDYVVPMTMAEDTNKHIKNSRIVIFENTGHSPLVDSLEKLCEEIRSFI